MTKDPIARLAQEQTLTASYEEPVAEAIRGAWAKLGPVGHTLRNVLHGTWLHEPLHSVLIEVPTGSWVGTSVFDGLSAIKGGSKGLDAAADATLVLGLVGALGAAVTGLNDWADTTGNAKRIGAVHGTLNVAMVGLYGASWVLRRSKRNRRTAARITAAIGFGVLGLSAHLGGNLVYEQGVGVKDRKPLD